MSTTDAFVKSDGGDDGGFAGCVARRATSAPMRRVAIDAGRDAATIAE